MQNYAFEIVQVKWRYGKVDQSRNNQKEQIRMNLLKHPDSIGMINQRKGIGIQKKKALIPKNMKMKNGRLLSPKAFLDVFIVPRFLRTIL